MLKVVISDDEELICRLVQALADWEALGMEVAGVAENGMEALELVKKIQPDILITDIRMPGCGGLELIEKAKAVQPQLEIVIISGYAHFEYAQSAIKFGVGNYLLKPINKEELTKALEMMGERCRRRKSSDLRSIESRENRERDRERIKNSLIQDVLRGKQKVFTRGNFLESYYFRGDGRWFRVFLLKIDCGGKTMSKAAEEIIRDKIKKIVFAGISKACQEMAFDFDEFTGYGIVNYREDEREKLGRELRNVQNELEARKHLWGDVEITIALGKEIEEPSELWDSIELAREILPERLVEGTGKVLKKRRTGCRVSREELLEDYKKTISEAVEKMDLEKADLAVKELRQNLQRIPGICGREILDAIIEGGKKFVLYIGGDAVSELRRKKFLLDMDQCGKLGEAFETLREFQREMMGEVLEFRKNEMARPIRIAKRYISEHFKEPITLEEVCAATGFSVSYFSAMFKKETGEGFSKYLTRVRIDEAKNLLRETSLPVSEVCECVGYNDRKHFTSVFHKATGLNPAEYRKLYG